ncbi:MAG: hypothetical protein FJ319_03435 [SAR202 cluster bacterium]|nr:hypothetical protein [SAR202 cluster bacterium]
MAEPVRILVVVAHPHDFMHCAATCGIHVAKGDQVTVVAMTSGAWTPHNEARSKEMAKLAEQRDQRIVHMTPEEFGEIKTRELRDVAKVFGVTDVRVRQYKDHVFLLRENQDAIDRIAEIILEVRPHVLITQSPYTSYKHTRPHGRSTAQLNDHTETAMVVMEARAHAQAPRFDSPVKPHKVAVVLFPGVYFDVGEIDFSVDVTAWFEKLVQADSLYKSQGHDADRSRHTLTAQRGYYGMYAGAKHVEPFVREKMELHAEIPVPASALKKAANPVV